MADKAEWRGVALPKGIVVKERSKNGDPIVYIRFTYKNHRPEEAVARVIDLRKRADAIKLAADKLEDVRRKIAAGTFRYGDEFPNSPMAERINETRRSGRLIREALEDWTKKIKHRKESTTVVFYQRDADKLAADIGEQPVVEFKVPQVEALIERLCLGTATGDEGRPRSGKRVRNLLIPLRKALDEEVKHEVIEANPLRKIDFEDALTLEAKHYERQKPRPYDRDERAALIRFAVPAMKNLIRVWIGTGMSEHEILGLLWEDIDFVHEQIGVKRKMDSHGDERKWTKNKYRTRTIKMTHEVKTALIAQKEHSYVAGREVFVNPVTGKRWGAGRVLAQNQWRTLCRRAGVEYRGPNQCRHTYVADGIAAGKSDWQLGKELGHNGPTMVRNVYGSLFEERDRRTELKVVEGGRK